VAQVLMDGTMTAEHHARLVALVQAAMGYPYRVKVRQVREIRWDAGGKQDDFGVSDAPSSDA
jgi:hypothetical protein